SFLHLTKKIFFCYDLVLMHQDIFLIVKSSALGDILQAFPVIDYLQSKCPTAAIDWVVERRFQSLVKAHPKIRRVIVIDTPFLRSCWFHRRGWQEAGRFKHELQQSYYRAIFDLQGNIKSG